MGTLARRGGTAWLDDAVGYFPWPNPDTDRGWACRLAKALDWLLGWQVLPIAVCLLETGAWPGMGWLHAIFRVRGPARIQNAWGLAAYRNVFAYWPES